MYCRVTIQAALLHFFIHNPAVENLHTISGQCGGIIATFVRSGFEKPHRDENF